MGLEPVLQIVLTAGIHWDKLRKAGIRKTIRNSKILVQIIQEKAASEFCSVP
jgi:hypothetical protein